MTTSIRARLVERAAPDLVDDEARGLDERGDDTRRAARCNNHPEDKTRELILFRSSTEALWMVYLCLLWEHLGGRAESQRALVSKWSVAGSPIYPGIEMRQIRQNWRFAAGSDLFCWCYS